MKMEHLGVTFLVALLIFGVLSFARNLAVGIHKAEAKEYSEQRQAERLVKAQEAQAKALADIARSMKEMKVCK